MDELIKHAASAYMNVPAPYMATFVSMDVGYSIEPPPVKRDVPTKAIGFQPLRVSGQTFPPNVVEPVAGSINLFKNCSVEYPNATTL